jgi:hypothetical protein
MKLDSFTNKAVVLSFVGSALVFGWGCGGMAMGATQNADGGLVGDRDQAPTALDAGYGPESAACGVMAGPEGGQDVREASPVDVLVFDASPPTDVASADAPAILDGGRPAACDTPSGPVRVFASVADIQPAVVGKWLYCQGAPDDFNNAPLELVADGTWYLLAPDSNRGWVRLQSFGQSGTYVITALATANNFDITFSYNAFSSTLTSNIALSSPPEQLLIGPGTRVRAP